MNEDAGSIDDGLEFRGCKVSEVFGDRGFYLITAGGGLTSKDLFSPSVNFFPNKTDDEWLRKL